MKTNIVPHLTDIISHYFFLKEKIQRRQLEALLHLASEACAEKTNNVNSKY